MRAGLPKSGQAYDPFSVSGDPNQLIGGAPEGVRPVGDVQEWYRKLLTSSSGIFYEDAFLQACSSFQTHSTWNFKSSNSSEELYTLHLCK